MESGGSQRVCALARLPSPVAIVPHVALTHECSDVTGFVAAEHHDSG